MVIVTKFRAIKLCVISYQKKLFFFPCQFLFMVVFPIENFYLILANNFYGYYTVYVCTYVCVCVSLAVTFSPLTSLYVFLMYLNFHFHACNMYMCVCIMYATYIYIYV